ncbi:NAD(P)-dependent glycerol-1-phosphate dehydrogenase [Methanosphaera sp. ISO3-F5]|uniref:NAD(P)-dependent glycerol-1-phosphate dehydrogenase n=1 Tax=Methanosphaera sp. ISO3-F5 TaxID=1452353 RepID=UPI002B26206D|nr:NAD(P)-dependent glycerol-1-phosphate dehydrogenase [Methanosphaera sp. ISO3-F5]WQH64217.1 NAD(P)-dependent glycerol-1-phosphate dehydrogenase [Methanosphaera sp. ISO3-F5]
MDFRNVQLPREIHTGPGIITEIGDVCDTLLSGENITLVTGNTTKKIAGNQVIDILEDKKYNVTVVIVTTATEDSVEKVTNISKESNAIIAVGGGKVNDVAKVASTRNQIPLISIPTTAAHDGLVSPRASIKNEHDNVSKEVNAPFALVADTQIISNAPYKFTAAGFADIISNFTAVEDWKLAYKLINEPFSDSAAALSLMTAKLLIEQANNIQPRHPESAGIVVKGLISSGMAISIARSSRPASGSEHKFSHALDKIAPKPALHGEQCGVGTILMMYLQGGDWKKIRSVLKQVNAPTNAKELGIKEEYIIEALTQAHNIRKSRYTILGDRGLTKEAALNIALKTGVID